jgi:hypothetical protein
MEVSGQLHAPAALPTGKEPAVPFGEEVEQPPEPVWAPCRKEKEVPLLPLPGNENQHVA